MIYDTGREMKKEDLFMHKTDGYRVAMKMIGIMVALMLFSAACSSPPKKSDGSAAPEKENESAPQYYDFEDVLVPRDLKLNTKSSFVYQNAGLTAGVLVFTSKVERNSLIQFFDNNMAKDNWRIVSRFSSPRTLLIFQKERRWCVINITDHQWETLVEIWTAPYSDDAGTGLLK